jgi:hypothetical protein
MVLSNDAEADKAMILAVWLQQLRAAKTEEEVVEFARTQLARIRANGKVPEFLDGQPLDDGDDIRQTAAALARVRSPADDHGHEADLIQQMLILFSLATDRLTQLESRGMAVRTPARSVPLP